MNGVRWGTPSISSDYVHEVSQGNLKTACMDSFEDTFEDLLSKGELTATKGGFVIKRPKTFVELMTNSTVK